MESYGVWIWIGSFFLELYYLRVSVGVFNRWRVVWLTIFSIEGHSNDRINKKILRVWDMQTGLFVNLYGRNAIMSVPLLQFGNFILVVLVFLDQSMFTF